MAFFNPVNFLVIFLTIVPMLLCSESINDVESDGNLTVLFHQIFFEERCKYTYICWPGKCIVENGEDKCLCPEGYYAKNGLCKKIEPKCRSKDCVPGVCNIYRGTESCLCPQGYTVQNGTCIEIKFSDSVRASIIMMMVVVAGASIIVTTLIGICICYYFIRRRSET
nr:fibrillin-1 isoform X3 [Parasteatoda tepidariorum]